MTANNVFTRVRVGKGLDRGRENGTDKGLDKNADKRIDQTDKGPPKRPKTGLRLLVPTSYRADGETNEFLRAYKSKWLSKIDFTSESHVESLLWLCFMVLALGREKEAEFIADTLIRHVDLKRVNEATRLSIASAIHLTAWLKAKRGKDVRILVEHAKAIGRTAVYRDRSWLSDEAEIEIRDALEHKKMAYMPFAGIAYWLSDPSGRMKAESVLAKALAATRAMMV